MGVKNDHDDDANSLLIASHNMGAPCNTERDRDDDSDGKSLSITSFNRSTSCNTDSHLPHRHHKYERKIMNLKVRDEVDDPHLLHCCYTAVTLLSHCYHTIVTLLLHSWYTVVTLLLHVNLKTRDEVDDPHLLNRTP
jgi:hypothetical protein